jgi:DNA-binding protein
MEAAGVLVSASRGIGVVVAEAANQLEMYGRVQISGINFTMPRLVQAVELLKHKVLGLHQLNEVELLEGSKVKLSVTLSFAKLASFHCGYQPPLPASQVENLPLAEVAKLPERDTRQDEGEHPVQTTRKPKAVSRPVRLPGTQHQKESARKQIPRSQPKLQPKPQAASSEWVKLPRRLEEEKLEENEIRVTTKRSVDQSVKEIVLLFKRLRYARVILKATGSAIPRAVEITEAARYCVAGLHQMVQLTRVEVTDTFQSSEGLDDIQKVRSVPSIDIILALSALERGHYGYQAPLPASQVREMTVAEAEQQVT